MLENFTQVKSDEKEIFQNQFGTVENIRIGDKLYCRVKINKPFRDQAEEELKAFVKAQGAPIIPRIHHHKTIDDDLWILFEALSTKAREKISDNVLANMIRDSAISLRKFKKIGVIFRPIELKTCLFNSEGRLKFLGIHLSENKSPIILSLFSSEEIIERVN